jgi:hypothetical protein
MKQVTLRILAATLGFLTFAGTASAVVSDERQITRIRSYSSGSASHIWFDSSVSANCGNVFRVQGDGQELVVKVALAAMLSGKSVTVEHNDTLDNGYCNVNNIRIHQ